MNTASLLNGLRGDYRQNEPMARHSSWRVGGPADHWYEPVDIADLAFFLQQLPESESIVVLGLGSNVLIRDGGIRGTVICTRLLNGLETPTPHHYIVEAGLACAHFAKQTAKLGSGGAEWYCGVPGTMGGALAMNAGAHGGDTWSMVDAVELIDRYGQRTRHPSSAFEVGYRHVAIAANHWFIRAWMHLPQGDRAESEARIRQLIAWRAQAQPTGFASCGSVFRNPEGESAGRLIDTAGLKGLRMGGACVSERHGNFIINERQARASDIENLIQVVHAGVHAVHGVDLIPEVRILGEPAHA